MGLWELFKKGRPPGGPAADAEAAPEPPPAFPYPLVAVRGAEGLDAWRRLREAWRAEGCCPVLLGDRDELETVAEGLAGAAQTPAEILRDASARTAADVLARRLAEHRASFADLEGDPEVREVDGLFVEPGEWPAAQSPSRLGAHLDISSGEPKRLVYLAKLPTAHAWEIPAYLSYGDWNDCPSPADQVALHRDWHARYGAEIWAVASDVVECWVPRPPADRAGAAALAREQYLYCSDIVEQGTDTLLALAAALQGADAWFFWWD